VLPGADQATSDLQVLEDQAHGGEAGERVVGSTELDECAVDVEQLEVLVERERARDGRDDEVERVGVLGHPLVVLAGGDELVSTELEGILLLARSTRDGDDLVGTHGLGEEESKVAETTNTNNTDTLAGSGAVGNKRVVNSHTTAHEGSGKLGAEAIRDRDGEGRGSTPRLGVTSVRLVTVEVLAVVGHGELVAVGLLLHLARAASLAALGLSTNTDTVADLEVLDVLADLGDLSNDLVANDEGVVGGAPARAEGVNVATANTAVGDVHLDIGLFEGLGLEVAPFHVAIGGRGVVGNPAVEVGSGRHCVCVNVNERVGMNSRITSTAAAFLLTTDTTSQTFFPIVGFVSCCATRLGRFSASPIFRRWTGARCHAFTTIKGYDNITNLIAKTEPDPRRRLCHISDEQGNRLGRQLDRAMAPADFHAPRVRTPQFASILRCIRLVPVLDDLGFLESTRSRYRIRKYFTCQAFTTFSSVCESR
jgi:hypothetical protein